MSEQIAPTTSCFVYYVDTVDFKVRYYIYPFSNFSQDELEKKQANFAPQDRLYFTEDDAYLALYNWTESRMKHINDNLNRIGMREFSSQIIT